MIEIRSRDGSGSFFLKVSDIESILEREGNTSEIIMTSGRRYASIWSKDKIADLINDFVLRSVSNAND